MPGHPMRCCRIWRIVESGSGNGHRQPTEAAACFFELGSQNAYLLARCSIGELTSQRMGKCVSPLAWDFFDAAAHPECIDLGGAGHCSQQYRNVVRPTLRINDIFEQERLPV